MGIRKSKLLRSTGASAIVLVVLVALGSGLVTGVVISAPPPPVELQPGGRVTSVPLTERAFDDESEVSVDVVAQDKQSLATDAAGKITAFTCLPDQLLVSGTTSFSVDGEPVVNFFTSVPLWRDLSAGDSGADAAAINEELDRLGYASGSNDSVTWATIAGFQQLRLDLVGTQNTAQSITKASVLWLPAPSVTIRSCLKSAGELVEPGEAIVSLPPVLKSAAVASQSDSYSAEERMLLLGTDTIPVPENGTITDAAGLLKISQSSQFVDALKDSDSASIQFNARWKLAKPVTVSVVPPGSVLGLRDSAGCVLVDNRLEHVTVVGSELGQTFVLFENEDMTGKKVAVTPPATTKCE